MRITNDSLVTGHQSQVTPCRIAIGADPAPMTAQAFDKFIAEDIETLTRIARAANIKAQ